MPQPFSIYREGPMDEHTLLYARADSGWLRGKSVVGPDFVNHGATPGDDGYRFCRAEGDYMDAALDGDARMEATLECWIRNFAGPDATNCYAATWFESGGSQLSIVLRYAPPTSSRISTLFRDRNGVDRWWHCQPDDGSVEALFASPKPFHVAATFNCVTNRRIVVFVNGKRYAGTSWSGTAGFSPTTLRLGRYYSGYTAYNFDGVLDEVRVSNVARYTADFPITRFGEGERVGSRGPGETVEVAGGCV